MKNPPVTAAEKQSSKPEEANNRLGRSGIERDFLYIAEGKRAFSGEAVNMQWNAAESALEVTEVRGRLPRKASYTSPTLRCRFPAKEFLPSWNIRLTPDAGQSFKVFVRVTGEGDTVSPWFFLGEGGDCDKANVKTEAKGWGRTHIDYLELIRPAIAFQYRVDFTLAAAGSEPALPQLHRFFMHYSGPGKKPRQQEAPAVIPKKMVRVKVPYRSQMDVEDEALRHHVCCPTCVAMVLEQYGINERTLAVCSATYNTRFDMHGIWPNASQAAFQYGCKAWVDRFRTFDAVRDYLETGRAIIASIRVDEGQLRGARYPRSSGHLIVITGLKKNKVLVNDPYSAGARGTEIEYEISDLEKVWLDRGGVAILIENTKRNGRQKK